MNNKLRQKILKELNYLLNEEEVDYSKAKAGGSFGSGGIGRTVGTAATWAGAGNLGVAAAGGYAGTIAAGVAAPVIFGALALGGAAYLAFRTAGWKEVAEDIGDGNIVTNDDVAKSLFPNKKYLDLTTMEDATDLSDFKSFMAAMKGMANAYADTQNLDEYNDFIQKARQQKPILDKICNTGFVLLNETGANDRMYYVKCARVDAYVPPAAAGAQCQAVEGIRIPLALFDMGLEDDIADSGRTRAPAGELPPVTCPLIQKTCGVTPSPQPKPDTGGGGTAFGKSFQCKPGTVAQFQNWLKKQGQAVCADDKFGQRTFAAAKALGNAKLDFSMYNSLDDFKDQAKKDQLCNAIAGDSRWRSESSTPEACGRSGGGGKRKTSASTKLIPGMKPSTSTAGFVDVSVKPQELINLGYTGQFIKADSAIPDSQMQKVSIDPKLLTVLEKGKDYQQLEESKNFYDNKKLIEAKSLFNKLTKSLI